MFKPLLDRRLAPGEILLFRLARLALVALGQRQQTLGRIGAAIEDDVFAGFAQFRIDVRIDRELAGIDDAHVHAGGDCMIEKDRMHGLAHKLIAAEGEGEIGDAARDMDEREALTNLLRGLDEIDAVIVVLFDAGRDGKDVRVENNVFRPEADFLGQNLIGPRANLDLARLSCRPGPSRRRP